MMERGEERKRCSLLFGNVSFRAAMPCTMYRIIKPANNGEIIGFYSSWWSGQCFCEFPTAAHYPAGNNNSEVEVCHTQNVCMGNLNSRRAFVSNIEQCWCYIMQVMQKKEFV